MKKLLLLMVLFPVVNFSQEKLKLESISANLGFEYLHHGIHVFNHFAPTVKNMSHTIPYDSGFFSYGRPEYYNHKNFNLESGFYYEKKNWFFNFGGSYNQRINRRYGFNTYSNHTIDTVINVVPILTSGSSSPATYEFVQDTLLLDSASWNSLTFTARTKNILLYAEAVKRFSYCNYSVSAGFGFGAGFSLNHIVLENHRDSWSLSQELQDDGVWFASIPKFNPIQGTISAGRWNLIESRTREYRGNLIFMLRPYIPIDIEYALCQNGFLSHIVLAAGAVAGYEFQIIKNGGVKPRFFWNYNFGLKYRI